MVIRSLRLAIHGLPARDVLAEPHLERDVADLAGRGARLRSAPLPFRSRGTATAGEGEPVTLDPE